MKFTPVESSNLKAVGYDEEHEVLGIRFNNGAEYQYSSVPKPVYEGLLSASSSGSYFHKSIRGTYEFIKIKERE